MQLARPAFAPHPGSFGRAPARVPKAAELQSSAIAADFKLFIATFAAGFLFVSILIG